MTDGDLFDAGFAWNDKPANRLEKFREDIAQKPQFAADFEGESGRESTTGFEQGYFAEELGKKPQFSAPSEPDLSPEELTTVATVATVADWRAGLALLLALPCPDWVRPNRWQQLKADADWFASAWADDAFRLGWSVTDVFGCSPRPWAGRVDLDGVVTLLRGRSVTAVTALTATIKNKGNGAPNTYYLYPWRQQGVPLWEAYAQERPQ